MRRYLIFAGSEFYPSGGWADLVDMADELGKVYYIIDGWREFDDWDAEALRDDSPSSYKYDWVQVVDTQASTPFKFEGTVEEVLYGLRRP
jgi:hypothetical protein